ncbi:MAG: bifunctional phosphoserine phosphatase/homoserine phosphotransferase ThrH [Verrucomicrobiales bacterium]|nr:bifunctional phosphoserine phosphatase/homoserine phosphotransferase ThrH [Verrucomicrobiales bacterium]MED5584909.1 bifunctional phosphoserine phosphatase/homoserine phosphotransferase ThrH [Verrucomicrobiota bacterium]
MSSIACLDLEGVLVPEIWINVAQRTGIDELMATTRDVADYSQLMQQRLDICEKNGLGIREITDVIAGLRPLDGAGDFLSWLRENSQVIILSDTFYEFSQPLMRQLDFPTLFCHRLEIAADGRIAGFQLRMPDQKREAVQALKNLNFRVVAAGDSYNDISMLSEADAGILFSPPENVIAEFPQFPVTVDYSGLQAAFEQVL